MANLKFKILFRLEQRKGKDGKVITDNVPILANITFCGKRVVYFTGYRVNASQWNDSKEEVKRNNFNKAGESASDINAKLRRIRSEVDVVFGKLAANGISPTPKNVREMLKAEMGEIVISRKSVIEYYEQYLADAGKMRQWSERTLKNYKQLLRRLTEYQRSTFYFEDVNKAFLNGFVSFLLKSGLRNEVVSKFLTWFNGFMNWATNEGYNANMEYQHFKPVLKTITDKIHKFALSVEEFQRIYTMDIEQGAIRRVRDIFCFCCATGQRYSDVHALRWSDVKEGYIDFTSQKTSEHTQVPLTAISESILKRYESFEDEDGLVFPVISNQKYNAYLKTLGKMAGMTQTVHEVYFVGGERREETYQRWEKLTTHVARRTFVTLGVFLGMPAEIIRSITGHHSTAVMDKYVKTNLAEKMAQMAKLNGLAAQAEPIPEPIPEMPLKAEERALIAQMNEALAKENLEDIRTAWKALGTLRGFPTNL